jgi:hypothetical protein
MGIAEALERIAEFERIEDLQVKNNVDCMDSDIGAVWAKYDFLVYLQKHEPLCYLAYQKTLGHPPRVIS